LEAFRQTRLEIVIQRDRQKELAQRVNELHDKAAILEQQRTDKELQ